MRLEITKDIVDDFSLSKDIVAFDDKENLYDVWVSKTSHTVGSCLGRIRVIMSKKLEILDTIFPLMCASSPYWIVEIKELEKYHRLFKKVK